MKTGRRDRWVGCCGGALVVAALGALGGLLALYSWLQDYGPDSASSKVASAYVAEIAGAKRAGIPTSPQALQEPMPSENSNAAPLYTRIGGAVEGLPPNGQDAILRMLDYRRAPNAEQCARAGLALKRQSALVALVHQAASMPSCVFVRDWTFPNMVDFREHRAMRTAAEYIGAESQILALRGQPLQAVKNEALQFGIARHAASIPGLLGDQVGRHIDISALYGLQRLLHLSGNRADVADAVRTAVENECRPRSLSNSLRHETGMRIVDIGVLRSQGPAYLNQYLGDGTALPPDMPLYQWTGLIDSNGILTLRMQLKMIEAADRPYQQSSPITRTLEHAAKLDRDPHDGLYRSNARLLEYLVEQRATGQAMADVTRTAAAILGWKVRHGTFPQRLSQAIDPVPIDPFDSKPLSYRRERRGFVVYSVGKTGKYAARNLKRGPVREVEFHYPMPEYERALISR